MKTLHIEDFDAIAFGNDHTNTLGVIQSLSIEKIRVLPLIWGERTGILKKSKFVKRFIAKANSDDCITFLKSNIPLKRIVIIPCCDEAATKLDFFRKDISSNFLFQFSTKYQISKLFEKEFQTNLASENTLLVPQTFFLNKIEELPTTFVFPGIIKPRVSFKGSKSQIKIVNDKKEAISFLKEHNQDSLNNFVIQEYTTKKNDVSFCGCSLKNGSIILPGIQTKKRIYPEMTGLGTIYLTADCKNEVLLNSIKNLIKSTGFVGLFSVEFAETEKGEFYFFEFNLRNDGGNVCYTESNKNIIYYHYCDMLDLSFDGQQEIKSTTIIHPIRHFLSFYHGNISKAIWKRDLKEKDKYMFTVGNDKRPIWHAFTRIFLLKAKLINKKMYK